MRLDSSGSMAVRTERVTTKPHVWLLHLLGRGLLRGAAAASCCHIPYDARGFDTDGLVAPVRWWRSEAARGVAQLEHELAD